MRRSTLIRLLLVAAVAVATMVAAAGAAPPSDLFTGAWVGQDPPPDNSMSRYMIGAPGPGGLRRITVFDPYATYCETNGSGTGSSITAQGTGSNPNGSTKLTFKLDRYRCANGHRNDFDVTTVYLALEAQADGTLMDYPDKIVTYHRVGK